MWPHKKKKGITLSPGECAELEIATLWRRDKNEVVIKTDNDQFILGEKSKLFLEIKGDNVDPIKIQIVPDFKNRKLDLVEVIDPSAKLANNNAKILFEGVSIIKEKPISFSDCLKRFDEDLDTIEKITKKYRKFRNISTLIAFIIIPLNIYNIIISNSTLTIYFNIFATVVIIYTILRLWNEDKKMYGLYEEYKKLKEETFGLVKEK